MRERERERKMVGEREWMRKREVEKERDRDKEKERENERRTHTDRNREKIFSKTFEFICFSVQLGNETVKVNVWRKNCDILTFWIQDSKHRNLFKLLTFFCKKIKKIVKLLFARR